MQASTYCALDLNNKAVRLLVHGKHHDCVRTLQLALGVVRRSMEYHDLASSNARTSQGQGPGQGQSVSNCRHVAAHTVALSSEVVEQSSGHGGGAFEVFNRAFTLEATNSPSPMEEDNPERLDTEMASDDTYVVPAFLLYNMGLCQHQAALQMGSSNGLKSAYRFYQHAIELLETQSEGYLRASDMVLLAALANNMAQITAFFYDLQATKVFRTMLQDIVENANNIDEFGDDDARVFFALNLLFVSELNWHALAPAA